jgi:hypothetical protein
LGKYNPMRVDELQVCLLEELFLPLTLK